MLRQLGKVENVVWFQNLCGLKRIEQQNKKEEASEKLSSSSSGYTSQDSSDEPGNLHRRKHKRSNQKQEKPSLEYTSNPYVDSLFQFGSELGNESFYIAFLPFVAWNIDEYIFRRLIFLWVFNMYVGQGLKDILCWPRPLSPPTVRLDNIYESEYGMPSTHAIAGLIFPFSLIYFSYGRFEYNIWYGLVFFIAWTTLVCLSRVYRGMHTFQDIIAGLSVASFVTALWMPYLDTSLEMFLASRNAWLFIVLVPALMIYVFPTKCMETRNDTARIICTGCGAMLAAWNTYYVDQIPIADPFKSAPMEMFSTGVIPWILFSTCRFVIGVAIIVPVKIVLKAFIKNFFLLLNSENSKSTDRLANEFFTIPYLFTTYTLMGYSGIYIAPKAFELVGLIW